MTAERWALILIIRLLVWIGKSRMGGIPSRLKIESDDMIVLLRGSTTMQEFADAHPHGYAYGLKIEGEENPDGGD